MTDNEKKSDGKTDVVLFSLSPKLNSCERQQITMRRHRLCHRLNSLKEATNEKAQKDIHWVDGCQTQALGDTAGIDRFID